MEAKILPVSSLNDIVFEGRNKAYGAYVLRQNYNKQLIKAAGISFSSVLLVCGFLYASEQLNLYPDDNSLILPAKKRITEIILEPYIPKPLELEPIQAAPTQTKAIPSTPTVATTALREIKIVSDQTLVTDVIPSQNDFTQTDPGLYNAVGELPGTIAPAVTEGNGEAEIAEENTPFVVVEQMPEFPGGLAAMYKFINKHLRYPAGAQAQGLEGAVILTFVVNASGQISNMEVLQDIGGGAAEEAKRVIQKMPDWQPGKQNKRAVPVRFTLPVRFKLN